MNVSDVFSQTALKRAHIPRFMSSLKEGVVNGALPTRDRYVGTIDKENVASYIYPPYGALSSRNGFALGNHKDYGYS